MHICAVEVGVAPEILTPFNPEQAELPIRSISKHITCKDSQLVNMVRCMSGSEIIYNESSLGKKVLK